MQVLNRLKMELSNQEYFTDEQDTQFLMENNLSPTDEFDKPIMKDMPQKHMSITLFPMYQQLIYPTITPKMKHTVKQRLTH